MNDTIVHRTYITPPDIAGHWGWTCVGCNEDASGYDDAEDVIAEAEAHGPIAADSLIPTNPEG